MLASRLPMAVASQSSQRGRSGFRGEDAEPPATADTKCLEVAQVQVDILPGLKAGEDVKRPSQTRGRTAASGRNKVSGVSGKAMNPWCR
jgi:hypothetical protein